MSRRARSPFSFALALFACVALFAAPGADAGGESTRFGELAVRLWRPLREAESGREEHYR